MPELPDVELYSRSLIANGLNRAVREVRITPSMISEGSEKKLRERLRGAELQAARRHGKNLFAAISSGGWLYLHFGMTGDLLFHDRESEAPPHTRLHLRFDDGFMAFDDMRMFGRVGLVEDVDEYLARKKLGPDPFDPGFDLKAFRDRLRRSRRSIKSALLDQQVIAGLGNLYADEMLFQAGVHPRTSTHRLSDDTIRDLYRGMMRILRVAIERKVEMSNYPRGYLTRYRDPRERCPRCRRPWRIETVAGRTTYFCPREQGRAKR